MSSTLQDIWSDLVNGLGISNQQYRDAANLALSLQDVLGEGAQLSFTGHSLGGGLASTAAAVTNLKAKTFNAAATVAKNPSEIKALQAMARLDENAAYMSASYGLGQILGESYKNLGYNTPKEMFEDFNKGELQQLAGMIKFIETKPKMLPAMRDMDASRIVGGYNGWRKNKDGERYADPNYVSKLQNYYKDLTGKSLK